MKGGLGNMPLTLWVVVAAVVLYLYIRRANLGIDTHPGEAAAAPVRAPQPTVTLRPSTPFGLGAPSAPSGSAGGVPIGPGGNILILPKTEVFQ